MTAATWMSMMGDWFVPITETGCWIWIRADNGRYGNAWDDGRIGLAHRISWSALRGPIPDGMTIDHVCRVPTCVNPDHLRVVSQAENVMAPHSQSPSAVNARKTHCPLGHPLVEEGRSGITFGKKKKSTVK